MKSSFQELLALVAHDLQARAEAPLVELLGKFRGLRSVFGADRDLLEAVIRRVEQALRGRSR